MSMHVDEARQQKTTAQVHYWNARMLIEKTGVIATAGHASSADQQTAILVAFKRARISKGIARRVKQGRAQQFALGRGTHCVAPTELTCDSRSALAR